MNCTKILDLVYEYEEEAQGAAQGAEHCSLGSVLVLLFNQARIALHTLWCPDCAQEIERYKISRDILREDFFPPSPGLEDAIMARIAVLEERSEAEETPALPGGLSTRGWVIAGLIIFACMATAFFGLDFQKLAHETGISFLLPVGITFGGVLTTYGALFIGSHLKELSERFGL
jgi:hypothetical protein